MIENTELLQKLERLLKQKRSKTFYAERLGISVEEVEELLEELRNDGEKEFVEQYIIELEGVNRLEEDFENGKATLTGQFAREIHTLEELMEKCNIDTATWKIDKYVQNYWGNGDHPHWQVKAFLSKRQIDNDLQAQKNLLIEEIAKHPITLNDCFLVSEQGKLDGTADTLLELSLPDLHIGKLGWINESGENYDIKIAVNRYKNAVRELLSRVDLSRVEKIHLPIGNDAIHVDNPENTTTSGTAVDTEGRFPKIIEAAKALFVETIDFLKTLAPVDVTIVRGNHDSVTMFMLGEILDAWYRNDPNVLVDSSPKFRKYYQYGDCGFLITHGDKEKHDDLALIFATEEPVLWASTKFRWVKLGHLHRKKTTKYIAVNTHVGVEIQILPSLSGTDEWHYAHGYLSNKQAKAFQYHKTKGEIAEYTYTV